MPRTLDQLRIGETGLIAGLTAAESTLAGRLAEMGLTEGEAVEVLAVAPWGDPMEIRLRGYRLSLRKAEAKCVRLADSAEG
jgi:Fe2+ transport system protein FeoA